MSGVNPRVDIAFKKIFGVEENNDLLISLINSIVGEEDQVNEIILLNPYNLQSHKNDKLSILDIKAKGVDGKMFNIEIQVTDEGDYDKRGLYYWAKLYIEQLQLTKAEAEDPYRTTKKYSSLAKSIGIHILNFKSIPESGKYHNVFHITEKETGLRYFTNLELHTVELEKFLEGAVANVGELATKIKTSLDRWVAFLTRHDLLNNDHLPPELDDVAIKKAMHVLNVMNFSSDEREAYDSHLKWLMLEASALEKKFVEGKVEGKIEGKIEGSEEKALEIAKKMIRKGRDLEDVSEMTDLSLKVLKELSREM